ncbi:protease complex subunit PrcB family protein [Winogradskyella ouciana]|uniref:PrcB C-terminal domain-containing protein n=1 Tax=Winogradskyella ouciana TaxID=2608631 RepID=A0A7K1GES9_9FLAO|nr:protease complex subunit PrcB family protein [Winogradskyella ouciana]MTE27786.1 hypothetical protein [Winogradskyella ouciana]
MKKSLLIILLSILSFSCDESENKTESSEVEATLIAKGNLHGAGEENIDQQNLVITDQNSWDSLLNQMNTVNNVSDGFTETDIDFSKFTVIAVIDDIKSTGGHSLDLNISIDSEHIVVNISELSPEGVATTVITQPYIIVKIPNSDLPIVFQ